MSGEQLRTQLQISETIRHIHKALVEADTRNQLESGVCRAFSESESYVFAWIGVQDPDSNMIVPRTTAGDADQYVEDLSIHIDESPSAEGPTATAVRTRTVQVVQRIREYPDYEPWRQQALEQGFESSAAIPLADESTDYGVLNLYSGRPEAFGEAEQTILKELGETIATALSGLTARHKLQTQKRRYKQLTERISDAYYAVDDDWTITYWNDQMAERTGTPAEEVLETELWESFPGIRGTRIETEYRRAMATKEPRSFETYLNEPYDYWIEVDVHPDDDGLSIFSREITARKAREEELKRANRRLNALVQNTSEAVYIKNPDGTYRFVNEAAAELFDMPPSEVVGKTDAELFDAESAEQIETVDEQILATGEPATEESVRYINDKEYVFLYDKYPYRDEDGEIIGVMGVSRDITERKRYERQIREQRNLLETLNEVVRHDIRNDLQLISGYTDLLADQIGDDSQGHLETVRKHTESAIDLTHSAADLAEVIREPDREPSRLAVRDVLEAEIEDLRSTFPGASIRIEESLPQADVLADEMLSSVFRNLLRNAVEHNDKPTPVVTVSASVDDESVQIEIADNGPGIHTMDQERIFKKGEKGLGSQGTGIGLYLVQTLVTGYGGSVQTEPNEPDGTVFVVSLPVAE